MTIQQIHARFFGGRSPITHDDFGRFWKWFVTKERGLLIFFPLPYYFLFLFSSSLKQVWKIHAQIEVSEAFMLIVVKWFFSFDFGKGVC